MASRHPAQAAPVHRVGRAALPVLTAVTLLTAIGCWLALTAATTAQQAGQTLALTAPALAAAIEAPFARFAQLTESVRPADFAATVDRLALTARRGVKLHFLCRSGFVAGQSHHESEGHSQALRGCPGPRASAR